MRKEFFVPNWKVYLGICQQVTNKYQDNYSQNNGSSELLNRNRLCKEQQDYSFTRYIMRSTYSLFTVSDFIALNGRMISIMNWKYF
jgi:hypothetical protein